MENRIDKLYRKFSSEVDFRISNSPIYKERYDCHLIFKDEKYKLKVGKYFELFVLMCTRDENEIISFLKKVSDIRKLQTNNVENKLEFVNQVLKVLGFANITEYELANKKRKALRATKPEGNFREF